MPFISLMRTTTAPNRTATFATCGPFRLVRCSDSIVYGRAFDDASEPASAVLSTTVVMFTEYPKVRSKSTDRLTAATLGRGLVAAPASDRRDTIVRFGGHLTDFAERLNRAGALSVERLTKGRLSSSDSHVRGCVVRRSAGRKRTAKRWMGPIGRPESEPRPPPRKRHLPVLNPFPRVAGF